MRHFTTIAILATSFAAALMSSRVLAQDNQLPHIIIGPTGGAVGMPRLGPFTPLTGDVPAIIVTPRGAANPGLQPGPVVGTAPLPIPPLNQVVPTDPLVRQTQIGTPPVGVLAGIDAERGVGLVNVPGVGSRVVRIVGPITQTANGYAARAVDTTTGVEFLVLAPPATPKAEKPGPLVTATVVRLTRDSAILERTASGKKVTDIVPIQRVYVAVQGGFVPAAAVQQLRPGASVFIPATGPARGTITFTRSGRFQTRASSTAKTPRK